ncbi:MAG: VWA domain-containing protein [Planctomycetes bacterium]|nr:VWA domain-containing protein [Planctomycetota bacterium]
MFSKIAGTLLLTTTLLSTHAGAQDRIRRPIPSPLQQAGAVFLESEKVAIDIGGGLATTRVTQTYRNPTRSPQEHTFLFPLPADAVVSEFRLTMNGETMTGEILDRDKARQIYENIVRRQRDPGLLELVGTRLIQARIFPIPAGGPGVVELSYVSPLNAVAGMQEFVYPLRRAAIAKRPLTSLVVTATIKEPGGLKTIYSPSHAIDVARHGDREATISFEGSQVLPDRDFQLLYGTQRGAIGISLLSHAPEGEDGTFVAFVTPSYDENQKPLPKDVVFVIDTSGSMAGEKIEQARNALMFCIQRLNPEDRFALVPFSTEARPHVTALAPNDEEHRTQALALVKGLEARGGTNIAEALTTALSLRQGEERLFQVLFLTDGLPTIGVTDPKGILEQVRAKGASNTRIFTFGVGHDVNVHLLDTMANETRASREYVQPGENLELKVTSLYDKIAAPALTQVSFQIEGLETYDVYPKELPDLFRGSQLMVVGRYKGHGPRAIRLKGMLGKDAKEWVFEGTFAEKDPARAYVGDLWAARKVGYLLDQIRLNGAQQELVDEVVRLGKKHGIVTPYTAFLAVEETQSVADGTRLPNERTRRGWNGQPQPPGAAGPASGGVSTPNAPSRQGRGGGGFRADRKAEASGERAVAESEAAKKLKDYRGGDEDDVFGRREAQRKVANRVFTNDGTRWIQQGFDPAKAKATQVTFLSSAYFELLKKDPAIGKILALGEQVVFEWKGTWYETVPESKPATSGDSKQPPATTDK